MSVQAQQERCRRDLLGGSAPDDAFRVDQVGRAAEQHRPRDLLMRQRTPADQWIASALAELGIGAAQGREGLKALLAILADDGDARLPVDRTVVVVLAAQLEAAPVSSGPAGVRECSRAVAWLSPLAAVVSARTAVDDCRVGGGKESGACQPDARADGKPTGAAETARETDPLNGAVCSEIMTSWRRDRSSG